MYEYFEHCIHAARLYILKETDDTIPAARRHMKVYVSISFYIQNAFYMSHNDIICELIN